MKTLPEQLMHEMRLMVQMEQLFGEIADLRDENSNLRYENNVLQHKLELQILQAKNKDKS